MSVLRLVPPKGETIGVDADEALVGREASCNVVVLHPSVSRRHALIKRKQDVFFVVDQGSANGTFVDSKRIVDGVLKEGAVLRFGSVPFKVEIRDELGAESVAEDELVMPPTLMGQPAYSETVVQDGVLPEDLPTPNKGVVFQSQFEEPEPTIQSPSIAAAPEPPPSRPQPPPSRPERRRADPAVVAPAGPPPLATPNRGPAFWLMIGAAALALLLVGTAMGLGLAFLARRMGLL